MDLNGLVAASQVAEALAAEDGCSQIPPSGSSPAAPARLVPAATPDPPPSPVPLTPVVPAPPPDRPPYRLSAAATPDGQSPASRGYAGPSAHRHTSGRGGLFFAGDRPLPPPQVSIQKINVFKDKDLQLTARDRRRLRTGVVFAINQVLRSTASFCTHPEDRQRTAVVYLEGRAPSLAMCESAWAACAVLSRGLRHRRIQQRRQMAGSAAVEAGTTGAAPSAAAAAAGTGGSAAATVGGSAGNGVVSTSERGTAQK